MQHLLFPFLHMETSLPRLFGYKDIIEERRGGGGGRVLARKKTIILN